MEAQMEPSTFLSLPLELQTEILYYLEFDDVLKVRQVCLALSSATRQRPLWMSILRNPPPPMDLYSYYLIDKKLDMCTSSDLEAIITDCLRRHTSWGDPSSVRVREIDVTHWRNDPIVILPGGRWAIVFSYSGDAFAFDLHTTSGDTYQHSLLFASSTCTLPWRLDAVVQTPEAGFQTELKMALFTSAGPVEHLIQVWLLRPLYDATGHVDGLKAELLSSFSGHPHSLTFHHSISGSFLGCLIKIEDSDDVYGVMIDWEKAHGREDWEALPNYVLPFGNMDCNAFFLLPNDTLVTSMELRNSYEVWALRSIEPVLRIEDAAESQPIGRGGSVHANAPQHVSLPVFCHSDGKARITTAGPSHRDPQFFKGHIISDHGVEDTTLLPIPPIEYKSLYHRRLYGIDKSADFEMFSRVTTIKAARWFGSPDPCSIQSFQSPVRLRRGCMHIDSFSGVMLIGDENYRKRVIMDFPLLHDSVS